MVTVVKNRKYWLGALLILLVMGFTFLPFILSSPSITRMIVARINEKLPGHLSVGSWLVGWQQGFLCQDIVYEDPHWGLRIVVPRLTSTQGLAELIVTPRNLGLIAVDSPVVELELPAKGREHSSESEDSTNSTARSTPFWEKLVLQMEVRNGLMKTAADGLHPETGFKDIDLRSGLAAGEVQYDLKFRPLDNRGELSLQGHLNLPTKNRVLLETLYTETDLSIRAFQIKDYLTLAAQGQFLPSGEGVISAELHIKTLGLDSFEVSGSADVTNLMLAGGGLGQDSPSFQSISLTLEGGEWSKLFWTLKQLQVRSDAGTLSCDGEYRDKKMHLTSSGNINIPVLFDQFPHLLRVQEKAFVETGSLEFTADLSLEGQKGKLDFVSRAENLGGLFNGHPFSWESPFTAILHAENDGLDVKVRRLQIESPFLRAFGQGDLSSFTLEASADLEKTLMELNRLFQHPWTGSGEVELSVKAEESDIAGQYTVSSDLNIDHFSLSRFEKVVVPNQHFSIAGSGQVPFSLLRERTGRFDLQLALSSWLGDIFFAMNGEKETEGLTDTRYSTDTNLQLDSLARLLHAVDVVPEDTDIGGELQVQAAGYVDRDIVGIDELNGRVGSFTLATPHADFRDREIKLRIDHPFNDEIPSLVIHDLKVTENLKEFFRTGGGSNGLDLSRAGIFMHDFRMDGDFGKMTVDEFVLDDWHKPLETMKAEGSLAADLRRLTPLLQDTDFFPAGITLVGSGNLAFSAGRQSVAGQVVETDLQLSDFSLLKGDKQLLPDDTLTLTLLMTDQAQAAGLTIKKLALSSTPLELAADGTVHSSGQSLEIDVKGTVTPKLDMVSAMLAKAYDMNLQMKGDRSQPFVLKYGGGGSGKDIPGGVSFSSALAADSVEYRGISLREITVPVSLAEDKMQARLQGRMNDGGIDLPVNVDFSQKPAVLRIPENSRIMQDVELGKPVVEGLLREVHPIFGIVASPSGRLDVRLDTFSWPVEPQGESRAEFSVLFDVSRVKLESSVLLRAILSGFALEKEKLELRDSEVECRASEARITCSPVRILAGGSEMLLSGSVGMDGSLDYNLEVPITDKLVSPEVYQFIEGEKVSVPITGTVGKPLYDQSMVTDAIRDLVKQAAVKVVEKQAGRLLPELMEGVLKVPDKK